MYNSLLYELSDGVARITLNRPDRFNAFNNEMSFEMLDALKQCARDAAARCVVITGAGDKAFCSGQDLKDIQGEKRSLGESVEKRYMPMIRGVMELEKPVIARVNGVAAGAGAGLAMAADISVAADTASYLFAFVNVGLGLDSGCAYQLAHRVGPARAFELATAGRKIDANEALSLGLVTQVVPAAELDAAVDALARAYAEKAPKALALTKKQLRMAYTQSPAQALEMEIFVQEIAGRSSDYQEGVNAFVEKRKPVFTGK